MISRGYRYGGLVGIDVDIIFKILGMNHIPMKHSDSPVANHSWVKASQLEPPTDSWVKHDKTP